MEPHTICIYHGNCADGFGAAWVVREFFKRKQSTDDMIGEDLLIDFFPGVYNSPPPDVKGKDVIIVDFSYKRAVIEEMLQTCKSMVIIDHHASAIRDLNGLDLLKFPHLQFVFDTKHSGAMLAWLYYFENERAPDLLTVIEHRDLWKFETPMTEWDIKVRRIQANLFSYPYDFDVWDVLMQGDRFDSLEKQGEAIERKHFKDIAELLAVSQRRCIIAGFDVPIANLPYTLASDACAAMNKNEPFAATYFEMKNKVMFSLRSRIGEIPPDPMAVDVSLVATNYSGGGHAGAAGFILPKDDPRIVKIFTDPVVIPSNDPYLQTK